MTINTETAERVVKWGSAGFSLAMAVLSIVNLSLQARDSKIAEAKTT